MNSDRKKYEAYALSVSEKWSLETVRSCFAAEYADRRVFLEDKCRLWKHVLTLSGKIGALRKKIKKLEQGNIAKARAIPLRNFNRFKTKEEAALAYAGECNAFIPQSILWQIGEWLDWLFAEANYERGVLP